MNLREFRKLSAHQRAMISIAILLDGREAPMYLANDSLHGRQLGEIAEKFSSIPAEFRNVLAGQYLRAAIEEIVERSEV